MQSWAHRRLSNLQEAHGEVPFPPILLPRKVWRALERRGLRKRTVTVENVRLKTSKQVGENGNGEVCIYSSR